MSGMDRLTELLPCPFCGGTNQTRMEGDRFWCHAIMCPCGIDYSGGDDLAGCIAAWNRRASPCCPHGGRGMSAPRYVELINMGGDYCGMGLSANYPDDDDDEFNQSRASDEEWVKAKDHDAVVRGLADVLEELDGELKEHGYDVSGHMRSLVLEALAKIAQEDQR